MRCSPLFRVAVIVVVLTVGAPALLAAEISTAGPTPAYLVASEPTASAVTGPASDGLAEVLGTCIAPQPDADLFTPDPNAATGCSAQLDCPLGGSISCTGASQCQVFGNQQCAVRCDGQTTHCPGYCEVTASCSPPCCGYVRCTSCLNSCSSGNREVTCDGQTYACDDFEGPD